MAIQGTALDGAFMLALFHRPREDAAGNCPKQSLIINIFWGRNSISFFIWKKKYLNFLNHKNNLIFSVFHFGVIFKLVSACQSHIHLMNFHNFPNHHTDR